MPTHRDIQRWKRQWAGMLCALIVLLAAGCNGASNLAVGLETPQSDCLLPAQQAAIIEETVDVINAERVNSGLYPLVLDDHLSEIAGEYACHMIENGYFDHKDPITHKTFQDRVCQTEYRDNATGENLALRPRSAAEAVQAWMESPTHRENILREGYVYVGLAIRVHESTGDFYWVLQFAGPGNGAHGCSEDGVESDISILNSLIEDLSPEPSVPNDP